MNKFILFFLILLLNSAETFSQIPNYRMHPSSNAQIEPSIVKHPANPQIMFTSAYTISASFRSEGVYFSTDGGATWHGSDTCITGASTNNHGGDPGPVIDKDGRAILTHQGSFIVGMFSNYSTNLGETWSGSYQIASGDQDKGTPTTDDVASSQFYGRTYLSWTRFLNPFPIVISYTSNGGVNWSQIYQINTTPSGFLSLGTDIRTGTNGEVLVCWAGVLTTSPQNEKFCGFGKSTNGGVNWSVSENIFNMNGVKTSSLQPWNIRINGYPHIEIDKTGGARNGWIYIVTGQKDLLPAGTDPDIVFNRSTDGGSTWSQSIRVNQDPLNNGKVQYFPAIAVDDDGGINIIYYDNRTVASDSMDVFLSRSTDGGNTWHDYRINQFRFKPKSVTGAVGAGNQGDNIGIVFNNGKLFPVWMQDQTGNYQVWYASFDPAELGITKISNEVPEKFSLRQNYPNPFNPSTTIEYDVSQIKNSGSGLNVSIKIFDVNGREVYTLANQNLQSGNGAGTYRATFDGGRFPSGVYYYGLYVNGNFIESRKMILMK